MGLGYHRLGFFIARLSDGAVAWLLEQFAQVRDKINGVSKHKCWLELVYMASEVAQDTHNSASELRITSDVAGTLRHAFQHSHTTVHQLTHQAHGCLSKRRKLHHQSSAKM